MRAKSTARPTVRDDWPQVLQHDSLKELPGVLQALESVFTGVQLPHHDAQRIHIGSLRQAGRRAGGWPGGSMRFNEEKGHMQEQVELC